MIYSKEQYEKLGESIIELLNLKLKSNARVDTSGGDKTVIGLGRTIERFYLEALETMSNETTYGIGENKHYTAISVKLSEAKKYATKNNYDKVYKWIPQVAIEIASNKVNGKWVDVK